MWRKEIQISTLVSAHHPPRHCFTSIDFGSAPIVVIGYFTEGEIYEYDFTLWPGELSEFILNPTGAFFNASIRNAGIPFTRTA